MKVSTFTGQSYDRVQSKEVYYKSGMTKADYKNNYRAAYEERKNSPFFSQKEKEYKEREKDALKRFDSIDKNNDGVLSVEELLKERDREQAEFRTEIMEYAKYAENKKDSNWLSYLGGGLEVLAGTATVAFGSVLSCSGVGAPAGAGLITSGTLAMSDGWNNIRKTNKDSEKRQNWLQDDIDTYNRRNEQQKKVYKQYAEEKKRTNNMRKNRSIQTIRGKIETFEQYAKK